MMTPQQPPLPSPPSSGHPARHAEAHATYCYWAQDDLGGDSVWETSCRGAFKFTGDGPKANGFHWCGYCGRPLVEVRTSEPDTPLNAGATTPEGSQSVGAPNLPSSSSGPGSIQARALAHADAIKEWREDDSQGPVCIDLTCDAEELLREAADALMKVAGASQEAETMQSSNPPRRNGHDAPDWIDRVAAEIRDLNPDYREFEVEVAHLIRVAEASARPSPPDALYAQLTTFVRRERALRDAAGAGGQAVGRSPCIVPSVLKELERMLASARPAPPPWQPIMVDRDADLRRELRVWLDTQTITSDNIGDIRRSLFMPWDSPWNGWVRDETAERENTKPAPPPSTTPQKDDVLTRSVRPENASTSQHAADNQKD